MIQVIVRALNALEFVSSHNGEPAQLYKIAEHLGLSSPTTANIVKTLLDKDYLEHLGRKKGYRLGMAAYQLTGNPLYQQSLINAANEPMLDLQQILNETTILAIIQNNKRAIIHQVECNQVLKVNAVLITDLYHASTGRVMMAYLNKNELDTLIKSISFPSKSVWPGAQTRAGLEKELAKIRKEEFVQIVSIHHTVGFAVPVYQHEKVIASLSVFVPLSRYTDKHREKISRLIKQTSKLITDRLH